MADQQYTFRDVARWMLDQVKAMGFLFEDEAAFAIERNFGKEFLRDDDEERRGMVLRVLTAFKELAGDTVVWQREDQLWRLREADDLPGWQQADDSN
jgi:hypothetical protein